MKLKFKMNLEGDGVPAHVEVLPAPLRHALRLEKGGADTERITLKLIWLIILKLNNVS